LKESTPNWKVTNTSTWKQWKYGHPEFCNSQCWVYKCLDSKKLDRNKTTCPLCKTDRQDHTVGLKRTTGGNREKSLNNDENINAMLVFVEAESHMYA